METPWMDSKLKISELLALHYELQFGNFITRKEQRDWGWLVHSEGIASPIWNHAAWQRGGETSLETVLTGLAGEL